MAKDYDKYEDEEVNIFDDKTKEETESSKKQGYTRDERETVILYSELDNAWSIFYQRSQAHYQAPKAL